MLDRFVNAAPAQPMDVLYTFGAVPQWAANTAVSAVCSEGQVACLPPIDVNPDGTGPDDMWMSFVTALLTRYAGRIQFYELWNEADAPNFWHGTIQQMVHMCQDAARVIRSIDKSARILSPSFHGPTAMSWFANQFLASGGAPTFDIVNFHGRSPSANDNPDSFVAIHDQAASALQAGGVGDRPFWDDENGPLEGQVADSDAVAAYVARAYVVHASTRMARFYYALWDAKPPFGLSGTSGATAYLVTATWLVGARVSPCLQSGTTWSCTLTRPAGYEAQLIWDSSERCNNGLCSTKSVNVDSRFIRMRDLSGAWTAITGHAVPVGIKPVLVENQ